MTANADQLLQQYLSVVQNTSEAGRIAFEVDQRIVGSVAPADAELIAERVAGVEMSDDSLEVLPVCAPDAPAALHAIAHALRDAGRAPYWRDELLPVCADDGMLVGSIERACVRTLGIRTFAVHLNGQCLPQDQLGNTDPDNYTIWLQRRAPGKPVDPNMLDTLAGGLIGMDNGLMEPLRLGLQREVGEEAGLDPDTYDNPDHVQTVRMRGQVAQGFFEEDCIVFHARLRAGARPTNRDGEVSEFMRVTRHGLLTRIEAGELTESAAIASLLAMKHADSQTI